MRSGRRLAAALVEEVVEELVERRALGHTREGHALRTFDRLAGGDIDDRVDQLLGDRRNAAEVHASEQRAGSVVAASPNAIAIRNRAPATRPRRAAGCCMNSCLLPGRRAANTRTSPTVRPRQLPGNSASSGRQCRGCCQRGDFGSSADKPNDHRRRAPTAVQPAMRSVRSGVAQCRHEELRASCGAAAHSRPSITSTRPKPTRRSFTVRASPARALLPPLPVWRRATVGVGEILEELADRARSTGASHRNAGRSRRPASSDRTRRTPDRD